jgi:hypothetical protein
MKKLFLLLVIFNSIIGSSLFGQYEKDTAATVSFKSFTAGKQLDDVKLNWSVACNAQFASFHIQRSDDGVKYTTINTFKADKVRCEQPFDYIDKTAIGQVYYKIKVGDIDGRFSTEKTISIIGKDLTGNVIKVVSPALRNSVRLIVSAVETGKADVFISNTSGVLSKKTSVNFEKGISNIDLDVADLPRGIYMFTYVIKDVKKSVRFLKG